MLLLGKFSILNTSGQKTAGFRHNLDQKSATGQAFGRPFWQKAQKVEPFGQAGERFGQTGEHFWQVAVAFW